MFVLVCAEPPYQLQKEGWGEFDLLIQLFFKDSLLPSPQNYIFDLNFKKSKYANWRRIVCTYSQIFIILIILIMQYGRFLDLTLNTNKKSGTKTT